jgi:hypothetical protein
MDVKECLGCEDDFYNGKNPMGVKACWSLRTAQLATRYRLGTWTTPTTKNAFAEVLVPTCYRQKGQHFYTKLPDFVRAEDVVRRRP